MFDPAEFNDIYDMRFFERNRVKSCSAFTFLTIFHDLFFELKIGDEYLGEHSEKILPNQ